MLAEIYIEALSVDEVWEKFYSGHDQGKHDYNQQDLVPMRHFELVVPDRGICDFFRHADFYTNRPVSVI
jgi:hypothetical protein